MKLIDILVEELPKHGGWPDGAVFVAQEEGGELWSFTSKPQKDCDDEWMDESHHGYHTKVGKLREASDHDISTITREQYESALAAKNEGWIEWGGGGCPVNTSEMVDVIFGRGGRMSTNIADCWRWNHQGTDSDIIHYRLHKPHEAEQDKAGDESDLNECIGQGIASVWNGEGLPPVGCECEFMKHTLDAIPNWRRGIIKYVSEYTVVIVEALSRGEFVAHPRTCDFRPLRSEADRKRDDICDKIYGAMTNAKRKDNRSDMAEEIYDAIAAGKIPGVKLDD